jgi:PhnB protein
MGLAGEAHSHRQEESAMSVVLNPYLSFRDNTREAMEFYRSVFGGELTVSTFAELGGAQDPSDESLVMHSQLTTEQGLTLMASDTPSRMELREGSNISVSLSGDDDATLRGYWERLSQDGTVSMPLEKAPWGDSFGMCTDRFGTAWLVNISGGAA